MVRILGMNILYKQIEQTIRSRASQMSVSKGTTQDDVHQCVRDIMRKNPDIFWFSHQWRYAEDEKVVHFRYTLSKERCMIAKKQIEDVVLKDFNLAEVCWLSVPEKVMYVYKWLAMYCKYNIYSAYNQTIYSVFVQRNSVCTGYAKATQYLFKLLGIESRLLFGMIHQAEKGSRHCWLLVKIDNQWFHHDPTFAVPDINDLLRKAGVTPVFGAEGLVYNYFCCDTESIKHSRIIENENELPVCTSTIDYKSLQDIPVHWHRTEGVELAGVRGCLLSDNGNYSDVYLWHSDKNVQSVVKIYKNDPHHQLLLHEQRIMHKLFSSSHVLHTLGATDKQDGLIIEQATPLSDLLCSHYYKLSAVHFCKLLSDVIDGLQDSIKNGIYYRDIHLNNIFRNSKGHYVLGDFGSCVWIDGNSPSHIGGVGSPWYSAPETYLRGIFDERSSVYGVGMLAYFLLNELLPPLWNEHGKESLNLRMHGHELPSPLLLKKPSCTFEQLMTCVIQKSLSFESSNRYQTLSDLKEAIKRCMSTSIDTNTYEAFNERSSVEFEDYLLIDGGASEKLSKFNSEKTFNRQDYNKHIEFESTCAFPEVLVSNGKNEQFEIVAVNADDQDDITLCDMDDNQAIGDIEMVDSPDDSPIFDDFATTAEGYPHDKEVEYVDRGKSASMPNSALPPGSSYDEDYSIPKKRIDDFASTAAPSWPDDDALFTYQPGYESDLIRQAKNDTLSDHKVKKSIWSRLFGKKEKQIKEDEVHSSVYAPSEVKPKSHFMVQVYLHVPEESDKVARLAKEADPKAIRRKYTTLKTNLKHGDEVRVELNIYGESPLSHATDIVTWRGRFTQCSFDYFVPSNISVDELSCEINLFVNGALYGNMRFITKVVEQPRNLNTEITSHIFKRIFISYSHLDSQRANDFAMAYKAQGVDYFYDRHKLEGGDVYEEKIMGYIDSADLFILCWSDNAAKSEYVAKEIKRAMQRAYPQQSMKNASLKIYPISIEPRSTPPKNMAGIYNFIEV